MIVRLSDGWLQARGLVSVRLRRALGLNRLFSCDGRYEVFALEKRKRGFHPVRVYPYLFGTGDRGGRYPGRQNAIICPDVFQRLRVSPPKESTVYWVRVVLRRAARKPRGGHT